MPSYADNLFAELTDKGYVGSLSDKLHAASLDGLFGTKALSEALTVHRSGNELLVRSAFSSLQDIVMPVHLANGLAATVALASPNNDTVALVPTDARTSTVWPIVATAGNTDLHATVDDNAPIFALWSWIGGNHGWFGGTTVTLAAHGKATADLGSQWTDGTRTYTLLSILSSSQLLFGNQYAVAAGVVQGSVVLPAATLTHVSGATNVGSISIAGGTVNSPLYPSTFAKTVSVQMNGEDVPDGESIGNQLTINESYTIVSYKALIDAARANIGVSVFSLISTLGGFARISNVYNFTARQVVVSQRVVMLEAGTINVGITQAAPLLIPAGGSRKQFMAGIGTVGGLNFSTLADLATMVGDIDIAPANYLHQLAPAQRMTQWAYNSSGVAQYGLAMGILPTADGHPTQRVQNAVTKSWFITNSAKKNYPQIVYNKTLAIGETVSGTAFRTYLAPPDTSVSVIASDDADTWVMLDQINTGSGQVAAPKLLGKKLDPVTRTTIIVPDKVAADGIAYNTPVAPGYGMWQAQEDVRLETVPGSARKVGNYFIAPQGLVSTQSSVGSFNILYLSPVFIPEPTPVDRVCLEVTTLGTGVLRHGIYANDPNTGLPVPTAPIADYGTVDATTVGIKETVLSDVVLPAGWHWHGLVWQGVATTGPIYRSLTIFTAFGLLNIGASNVLMSGNRLGVYVAGVAGPLGALGAYNYHSVYPTRIAYRRS